MTDKADREHWPLLTRAQVAEAVEYATSRPYRRMYRRAMRAERALRRLREAVGPSVEEAERLRQTIGSLEDGVRKLEAENGRLREELSVAKANKRWQIGDP